MRNRFESAQVFEQDIEKKVRMHLITQSYMQSNIAIAASLFCALIVFIGFFSLNGNNRLLFLWFIFYLLVTTLRIGLVYVFENQKQPERNIDEWHYLYLFSALLGGLSWGLPAIIMLPFAAPSQPILILLMIAGLITGSVPFSAAQPLAAISFLVTAILPYIVSLFFLKYPFYLLFDAALVFYLVYTMMSVFKMNRIMKQSLSLKFENEHLLRCLVNTNKQLSINAKRLKEATTHDPLTQVANWDLFGIKLQDALDRARVNHTLLALLYIDLDHFNAVNAAYGYRLGDYVLLTAVDRLKNFFGTEECISRLSSDEFVVILENMIDMDAVSSIAEQLSHLLSLPKKINRIEVSITVSIGVSIFPDDGTTKEALFSAANQRMLYVKKAGGNHFLLPKKMMVVT